MRSTVSEETDPYSAPMPAMELWVHFEKFLIQYRLFCSALYKKYAKNGAIMRKFDTHDKKVEERRRRRARRNGMNPTNLGGNHANPPPRHPETTKRVKPYTDPYLPERPVPEDKNEPESSATGTDPEDTEPSQPTR